MPDTYLPCDGCRGSRYGADLADITWKGRSIGAVLALTFDEAAAFIFTYGTSWHALKQRGQLKAGDTLLVLGAAGGVGLAAVELGKAVGARVIAACSSEEKVALAKAHGADDGVIPTMVARHAARCPSRHATRARHEHELARFHRGAPQFLAAGRLDAIWQLDEVLEVRDYKTEIGRAHV